MHVSYKSCAGATTKSQQYEKKRNNTVTCYILFSHFIVTITGENSLPKNFYKKNQSNLL